MPWFFRQFASPMHGYLEARICRGMMGLNTKTLLWRALNYMYSNNMSSGVTDLASHANFQPIIGTKY